MSTRRSVTISNEILDDLEAKIINRLMQKIESIVAKKCEEVFAHQYTDNEKKTKSFLAFLNRILQH